MPRPDRHHGEPPPATVARNVHWRAHPDGPCLAAIITHVYGDEPGHIDLMVLPRFGGPYAVEARSAADPLAGSGWHWPERV